MTAIDHSENDNAPFIRGVKGLLPYYFSDGIFGGRTAPSDDIMGDVLTLSQEAKTSESGNARIAQLLFTTGSGNPLWYVNDSRKRTLSDYDPERDVACKAMLPEYLTPYVGMASRLGYAHRVYARTTDGEYVSATIDADIDVPLFTPVDEWERTHEQDELSRLIVKSVLGKDPEDWDYLVKEALDDLVNSDRIEKTPYWALKKAFEFFADDYDGFLPIVEVDPVSLKAHFTLYSGYMPMKVHQELTRLISEVFFKGMYDKALTEDHRALALTRVGSMSKSDGLNGKFLFRRFLWSFYEPTRVALWLLLIRSGIVAPEASEKRISELRSLALEKGITVNRDRRFQYEVVRLEKRPDDMPSYDIDALILDTYAETADLNELISAFKAADDRVYETVVDGAVHCNSHTPSWVFGGRPVTRIIRRGTTYAGLAFYKKYGWDINLAEDRAPDYQLKMYQDRRPARFPKYGFLSAGHLIDYGMAVEPPTPRTNDLLDDLLDDDDSSENDRPVRRRRAPIVVDEDDDPVAFLDKTLRRKDGPVRRSRIRRAIGYIKDAGAAEVAKAIETIKALEAAEVIESAEAAEITEAIKPSIPAPAAGIDNTDPHAKNDRPVRRRRFEPGREESPVPVTPTTTTPADDDDCDFDLEFDDDDSTENERPIPLATAESAPAIDTETPDPAPTHVANTDNGNNPVPEDAPAKNADRVDGTVKQFKLPADYDPSNVYLDISSVNNRLLYIRDRFIDKYNYIHGPEWDLLTETLSQKLKRLDATNKAVAEWMKADPECQALEAELRALREITDRENRKRERRWSLEEQEEKYGKLAWKRTLKEKSRTNAKGRRIGVEALYLMMSKGQNCLFGGLFGDAARMSGLMTFVHIVTSDKGKVTFDEKPHVLKSELNNRQWSRAVDSVAKSIMNAGYEIYSRSATKLARILVDTALYGMGQIVHEIAMDITTNDNLNGEWLTHFERALREIGHPIVSSEFADPYAVRMRHRKIRTHEGKSLDVLTNVYMKGKRGALTPMEFVDLTGAVLNFDTENLYKLPEKAALKAARAAIAERPELHHRKRDLRENSAYVSSLIEDAEKGFRPARSPEEYAQNTATLRSRRMDVIRRSGFVLEDKPITPEQAHEIVDAMKGDTYDPATESFTAIMSLTKDMLGDKDHKYDNLHEIQDDIVRSDDHWTDGDMAHLKALLAVHAESLSRSKARRKSSGSSRVIDFSGMYRRDWNDPKAMKTPWPGELLAKQFARVTRDMDVLCHDDVVKQDKEYADLAFSKNKKQKQEQEFKGGVPNFLLPRDIDVTPHSDTRANQVGKPTKADFFADHSSVSMAGTDAYQEASQVFEPVYTFIHRGSVKRMTATKFMMDIDLSEILNGKIYMAPTFSRDYGHGAASGKIDQFPCPTSSFLKAEKDEDGNVTIKSVADAHYYSDKTFVAAVLILSVMQNKRRISFDRAIKGLHSIDKIQATREYDGNISKPFSSRYFSMQSGICHNECNSLIQDLSAIGIIDREGGRLQGTLTGPATTEKERLVQEVCEQAGPGIIGQERVTKQSFVESGQFLSTYTTFHKDGFIAEKDGEIYRFTADEIIKGFENLNGVTDLDNPFMMVIESALRRHDAKVDRLRDFTEDSLRKSNLFEVRMDYVLSKVELLSTDQYQNSAKSIRSAIVRNLGYVAPSQMDGLTDVDAAFRNTSNLYKGTDSELVRTYGYWVSAITESSATTRIPGSQIRREFSRIIRFVNGRGSATEELIRRISDFTNNILTMEIAYRSWKSYANDLAAEAREFRRSYLALLGAVSKAAKTPYTDDLDLAPLISNGPPIVQRS